MAWSNLSGSQMVSFTDAQTSGYALKEGQSHVNSTQCMTKSEIVAKYTLDIGTTYGNPYADNQLVPVIDWIPKGTGYCPSLTDLSSITSNFVGSGGYGTWYFTFTYIGTLTTTATLWYRTRRDGVYTPNQFYPPFRYTATFSPGSTHTLTGGSTQSPATYLEFEAFECNESIIAPYIYYVNYDTEQGTTAGYVTACAFGPATYPVYTNASSLSGIGSGTVIYQDPYGYPYYSGGVTRWLAIGETEDGAVTRALQLNIDAVVQQNVSCAIVYYNTQQSGTATRNNCSAGYTGGSATLTVLANTYSSSTSVEDANNQAIAYINANKQAYANANGTCTPTACPSLTDLSSVTRNFVGSGGYGTWYFTFTYNGPSAVQATLWYRTRRDGIYTPNQFYPPYRYTETFTPGHTYTLSAGYTESPGTYVEFEAFECNESIIAPYVYYVNYDTEQGTTAGYTTACAFGPATYPIYTNVSSLQSIGPGTVIYQSPYGYPYYAGGVDRWLAIGETNGGSVTYGLELTPNAVVIQSISCAAVPLPTTYYSTPQSGTATRNNCSEGYTGSTVTLSVIANGYSSTISVEDANNQAIAYINANKQAYANANGTCASTCADYTIGTTAGYGTTTTYTDCDGTSQQVTIGGVNGFEAYSFCALYGSVVAGNETSVTYNGNCGDSTAVDCQVSGWSDWSECIDGSQTQTRTIITQPSNGGTTCPVLSQTQSCTGYVRISYVVNLQGGISPGGFEINTQAGNIFSTSYTDSGYVDVPYNSLITSTIYAPVGDTSSGQTNTFYTRVIATDNGGVIADSGVPTSNASSTIDFYATSDVTIQADGTVNSNGGGGELIQ